jgi:polyhydroxyalkanoate synthesis regulator phasin
MKINAALFNRKFDEVVEGYRLLRRDIAALQVMVDELSQQLGHLDNRLAEAGRRKG